MRKERKRVSHTKKAKAKAGKYCIYFFASIFLSAIIIPFITPYIDLGFEFTYKDNTWDFDPFILWFVFNAMILLILKIGYWRKMRR